MNNLILIAVGGTGARVAQSVVAMAAAGLPAELGVDADGTKTQLYIKLVDIDVNHEDGKELQNMIENYNTTINDLIEKNPTVFGKKKWRPLKILMAESTKFVFDAQIGGAGVKKDSIEDMVTGLSDGPRLLLDALLNEDDRRMDLLAGCKARPRIGALLWQHLYNADAQGFWEDIRQMMGQGNDTKIMFAGSVFGGTGASGVPTLAKLLRKTLQEGIHDKDQFGITLMTPYFQLQPPEDALVQSKKFTFESKMAMRYYESDSELLKMDCVQIVGDEMQTMYIKVKGQDKESRWEPIKYTQDDTGKQNDPAMPAELVAAIGIHMFFAGKATGDLMMHSYAEPVKKDASKVYSLNMLPESGKSSICLYRLTRFCHILLDYCEPMAFAKPSDRAALFHNLWEEDCLSRPDWRDNYWKNKERGIGSLIGFSRDMKRWLDELDHNGMRDVLQMDYNRNVVRNAAVYGRTGFLCHGVKGNRILGRLNDRTNVFFKDIINLDKAHVPQVRQRIFIRALLEACSES